MTLNTRGKDKNFPILLSRIEAIGAAVMANARKESTRRQTSG